MYKIFKKILIMGLTASLILPTGAYAAEQNSRSDLMVQNGIELIEKTASNNLVPLTFEKKQGFSVNLETVETDEAADAQPAAEQRYYSNKYGWNNRTLPFNPSTYKWTTDKENYSRYAYDANDKYFAALTSNLSNDDYANNIREGYLDDQLGTQSGGHMYVHEVSEKLPEYNNLLYFLDNGAQLMIFEKNTESLIFNSGTLTGEELLNPDYIIGGTTADMNVGGTSKRTCNLNLAAGQYYFLFFVKDGYTGTKTHYAMFTGKPLPVLDTYNAAKAHQGTAYVEPYSSYTTVKCPSMKITTNGSPDIYAIKEVKFTNNIPDNSSAYAYVSSVQYKYGSPNDVGLKSVGNSGDKRGPYIDSSPISGSIVGTYNFEFIVSWSSPSDRAYFFANTSMNITYLRPIL